jgi:hypothetical protein
VTIRYEYISQCCSHNYVEQRSAEESAYFTKCNACGIGDYELVKETSL